MRPERFGRGNEDRQHFDCATWLHKPREMAKEKFKREVAKELTGRETEVWEINDSSFAFCTSARRRSLLGTDQVIQHLVGKQKARVKDS